MNVKNSPTLTEKYARRAFTKSIATALVATPLIPSLVKAEKSGAGKLEYGRVRPQLARRPLNLVLNHMPPMVLESSSLEIESAAELFTRSVAGNVYTYEQRSIGGCFVYGNIARVNIISDRGRSIYSEAADGRWEIRFLLQRLIGDEEGELEFEPTGREVVLRSATEGFFELTVVKDLGRVTEVRKRKLNRYRTLKKYGFSRLDSRRFRIGQVTVSNQNLGTQRFPEDPTKENTFAKEGFKIFVEFEDDPNPNCKGRELPEGSKSFWRRFFSIFRF